MISNSQLLTQTLIQRGESDNYIRSRLLSLGLPEDEAKALIHESRLHSDTLPFYPKVELEIIAFVLVSLALILALLWLFLSIVLV
jgi:hypothetical protein